MLQNQKSEPESEPKCSKKSFEIWRILSFKDRNDLFSTLLLCEKFAPKKRLRWAHEQTEVLRLLP